MMWKMPASRIRSLRVVGEEIALARHHRGGDGALVAADDGVDPQAPAGCGRGRRRRTGFARASLRGGGARLRRAERRADRADAGEIGVAREIVAAGQHRARRRQQPGLDARRNRPPRCRASCARSAAPGAASGLPAVARRRRRRARTARRSRGNRPPRHGPAAWRCGCGRASAPCARCVAQPIARKPALSAATPSSMPRATGRRRSRKASASAAATIIAGGVSAGSVVAARLSATPPMAAIGNQRKNRRSSASRASAAAIWARRGGAQRTPRTRFPAPAPTCVPSSRDML